MSGLGQATEHTYDIVGVGFGPSNIALAIAIDEHNRTAPSSRQITAVFLEQQDTFGWHRGMLIDDATMQISFLKDLVTFRNPTSDFSFVSYLHQQRRLADFTNHQILFPTRVEFHSYLEWCATRLADRVDYGQRVARIRPSPGEFDASTLEVVAESAAAGVTTSWRARNVVLATGLRPFLPEVAVRSDRVWHSEELMHRVTRFASDVVASFLVVGAGQSAAETLEYLHRRFPNAQVGSVFAKYGFTPADDTPFVNGIFDPDTVNTFFNSPPEVKDMLVAYHRNTNYSVVDAELINELYRRRYQEKVRHAERLHFLNMSRVTHVCPTADHVAVTVEHLPTRTVRELTVDALVYATGYRPVDPAEFLGPLAEACKRDAENRLEVDLNYRVLTSGGLTCGIYLQGPTEYSHGLSATLLSNTAVRAGRILAAIAQDESDDR
ncbi:MAG TPA: SidA/IucD/PvdA family monooxygenase [Pseudonocardiaceae bacterium]|nr:SidA/IucD/PvdA family monooxygenase [Pseudonocardiaceae bacterium]